MQINIKRHGHQRYEEFKAEVPYTVRPQVSRTYTKHGTKYVETKDKRTFIADTFFKIFGHDIKNPLKSKFYKGENPCRLLELTTK